MKAKEYAQRIINAKNTSSPEFEKAIYSVINDLFGEVTTLVKSRNCQSDSAYIAVFDEIDNKWIAICRIVNKKYDMPIIKPTGFRELAFNIADKAGIWQMRMIWKPKKIGGIR